MASRISADWQALYDHPIYFLETVVDPEAEPNSGLGKAITYLLRHWRGLTLFPREARAPLDNNV